MSPQEKLEFEQMKTDIKNIKSVSDAVFVAELNRRLGGLNLTLQSGVSLSGTTVVVRNSSNTGTELVANDYTGAITLTDNQGNVYKLGYY